MSGNPPLSRTFRRRSRWRALTWITAVALVAVIAIGVSVRLFVFPHRDEVSRADAIIVIGPPYEWRLDLAERLVADDVSDNVVISTTTPTADETFCEWTDPVADVVCFYPQPFTTAGEARWVREEARSRGWESVVVITGDAHIERARFIFRNCLQDEVDVAVTGETVEATLGDTLYQVAYQSGGFLKAIFVTPRC